MGVGHALPCFNSCAFRVKHWGSARKRSYKIWNRTAHFILQISIALPWGRRSRKQKNQRITTFGRRVFNTSIKHFFFVYWRSSHLTLCRESGVVGLGSGVWDRVDYSHKHHLHKCGGNTATRDECLRGSHRGSSDPTKNHHRRNAVKLQDKAEFS